MATDRREHPASPPAPAAGGAVISLADRMRARQEVAPAAAQTASSATGAARARVAAVTDTCWCCRQKVRAVVGVIVDARHTTDGSGFIPLEAIDETLVRALDTRHLARRGIGELRHRESPGVAGGYIANGCLECDALIGRFHLEDLLTEHRVAGGSFGQLDIGIAVELDLAPAEHRTGFTALG